MMAPGVWCVNTHIFVNVQHLINYMWQALLSGIIKGDTKALARSISLVENEQEGYAGFLATLPGGAAKIIGVTGPPGAGKSTLVDGLIKTLVTDNKRVGVLCVDPSS